MTKENQDFDIQAGDTVVIEDTVDNDDGTDRDISDHSATFTLAEYAGDTAIIQMTDSDSQVTVAGTQNDMVTVRLNPTDTEDLVSTKTEDFYYEIQLTDSNGDEHTVTTGTITVKPSY